MTDGTFDGLLTAVFESYSRRVEPTEVRPRNGRPRGLVDDIVVVATEPDKTEASSGKASKRYMTREERSLLYQAFLTGAPMVETLIYRRIRQVVPGPHAKESGTRDPAGHLAIERLSQKVRREARPHEGACPVHQGRRRSLPIPDQPAYDILPLIRRHFEKRYADQRWVIFDTVQKRGLYFDGKETAEVLSDDDILPSGIDAERADDQACRQLWKTYFAAVNITERRNPKLRLRHLPRRYWEYLPEKN